jgi:hypothetical protein
LDFFVISNNILPFIQRCDIAPTVPISLFDHKPIFLDFTKNKVSSKLFINRTILNNPRTDDVVLAAFADTYLSHAAPTQPPGLLEDQYVFQLGRQDPLATQKIEVGNFVRLCKEYNALVERTVKEKNNNLLSLLIAEKATEINLQREKIWCVERYSRLTLTCDNDFFFEALASNIKGQVISFQSRLKKLKTLRRLLLLRNLIN